MDSETSVFRDVETALRSLGYLESMLGESLPDDFLALFEGNPDADLALANLGRLLATTANPLVHLQQLVALPRLARLLLLILGASQPIANSLIQNPELASLVLDASELGKLPNRNAIVSEGQKMLQTTTSFSHRLDRLRFIKQRWTLPIVINDLARTWKEETVWTAVSDLAESLVELAVQTVWEEYAASRGTPGDCPVMVVGFGKLGGRELNFSSDIDLVYVIPDGVGDRGEADATKFCELLGRALSDRMGRGSVYRIDLRLRPYGASGPLVASMRAVESYYSLYAEQWEVQALIRSKPICGPSDLIKRWGVMRRERCFRPHLSEPELEAMAAMKTRIEERSDIEDIKRGAGGIRDVEFLVQALQLIHGHRFEALQVESTLEALRELEGLGLIERPVADSLEAGYTFLRQLEHRCQLVGDLQTHSIPHEHASRERLAKLMGASDWASMERELEVHRRTIQTLYRSTLRPAVATGSNRDEIAAGLGNLAPGVLQWFDSMPSSDAFYASLVENQDSLARVKRVALAAPKLVNEFKSSVGLTEMLVSGEIEEEFDPCSQLLRLSHDSPLSNVADVYRRSRTMVLSRWVLQEHDSVWQELSILADALIVHCAERLAAQFDVIALGSLGGREMGMDSDADLILVVGDARVQAVAEVQAQEFLLIFSHLKRNSVELTVDLRLRPDGGKGMLVRSLEALNAYDSAGIEMWERFALGQARLVRGGEPAIEAVRRLAYASALTSDSLTELLDMKNRMENERVKPQHLAREVKLGHGGLSDIEWTIHLLEMKTGPESTQDGDASMASRVGRLVRDGQLNTVEAEQIFAAQRHLLEVRLRLSLLGCEKDVIPENPDRLERLAKTMDFPSANVFLAEHKRITESCRAIYLRSVERLKA